MRHRLPLFAKDAKDGAPFVCRCRPVQVIVPTDRADFSKPISTSTSTTFTVCGIASHLSQRKRKMGHPCLPVSACQSHSPHRPSGFLQTNINVNNFHCMRHRLPPFAKDAKDGAPFVCRCRPVKVKILTLSHKTPGWASRPTCNAITACAEGARSRGLRSLPARRERLRCGQAGRSGRST